MRLDKLLYDFESQKKRPPYVAIIKNDGSVTVQHSQRDDMEFPDETSFQSWKDENLGSSDCLEIITVNPQGKQPKEI